jgi:hypothetical protein
MLVVTGRLKEEIAWLKDPYRRRPLGGANALPARSRGYSNLPSI